MASLRQVLYVCVVGFALGAFAPFTIHADTVECSRIYEPLCGAQPVEHCVQAPCIAVYHTYWNHCEMAVAGALLLHAGSCMSMEVGPVYAAGQSFPSVHDKAFVRDTSCAAWYDGCNFCSASESGVITCTTRSCKRAGKGFCSVHRVLEEPIVETAAASEEAATAETSAAHATTSGVSHTGSAPLPGIPNTGIPPAPALSLGLLLVNVLGGALPTLLWMLGSGAM